MRLLLLSNSTNFGGGYLDHASGAVAAHFKGATRIAFVPFALKDQAGYWERARDRFATLGIAVDRVEEGLPGMRVVDAAHGLFVGGGNTFRLLNRMQRMGLIALIRERVRAGMPYMGASAGTVVASPTLKTTNDMPIVEPEGFEAIGLVPYQINCHYVDPDPTSRHMGETRETRIREFLEENDLPVVGLREGSWIEVGEQSVLRGPHTARLFRRGGLPMEAKPGTPLDPLVT